MENPLAKVVVQLAEGLLYEMVRGIYYELWEEKREGNGRRRVSSPSGKQTPRAQEAKRRSIQKEYGEQEREKNA